jgi:hypothetical protein
VSPRAHADHTAHTALGRVARRPRTLHKRGCVVDGGTLHHRCRVHARCRWFSCPRCEEQAGDPITAALVVLDRKTR